MQLPLSPPNPKHQIQSPPKKLSLGSIPSDKSVDPPPTESSNAASLGRGSERKDPSMTELHPSMGQQSEGKERVLGRPPNPDGFNAHGMDPQNQRNINGPHSGPHGLGSNGNERYPAQNGPSPQSAHP